MSRVVDSECCLQVLRSFLHLQLRSVDEPVGSMGGRTKGGKGATGSGEKQETAITGGGSQLTRKQRKVCSVCSAFWRVLSSLITQRLKAVRELNRDLKETEATESREKKNKLVGEREQSFLYRYILCV